MRRRRRKVATPVSYQTQGEVEQSRAAVEQDGDQRGGGGEEEPHVSAHHHPQRLQDLEEDAALPLVDLTVSSGAAIQPGGWKTRLSTLTWWVRKPGWIAVPKAWVSTPPPPVN